MMSILTVRSREAVQQHRHMFAEGCARARAQRQGTRPPKCLVDLLWRHRAEVLELVVRGEYYFYAVIENVHYVGLCMDN